MGNGGGGWKCSGKGQFEIKNIKLTFLNYKILYNYYFHKINLL